MNLCTYAIDKLLIDKFRYYLCCGRNSIALSGSDEHDQHAVIYTSAKYLASVEHKPVC
jgi:hypothetical protein